MKALCGLLLAAFLLCGCGAGLEKKVIGTWKVDTAKTQMSGDKIKTDADKKMMMAMLETFTLDVKEDKTFKFTVIFPIEGTWALAGSKLTLTPKLKEGETFAFAGKGNMEFDVDGSGTSMSVTVKDKDASGTLVMVKPEAAK